MKQMWKGWLRGALAVVFAATMVFSYAPAKAFADTAKDWTGQGTAIIKGITDGSTMVNLYKVANTSLGGGNQLVHAWVGPTADKPAPWANEISIEQWLGKGSAQESDNAQHQIWANKIAEDVYASESGYTVAKSTDTITNGQAEIGKIDAGLYLVEVKAGGNDSASNIYQNTIVYVGPKAQSDGSWSSKAEGSAILKFSAISITDNASIKPDTFADKNVIDTLSHGETVYYQMKATIPNYSAGKTVEGPDQTGEPVGRTFTITNKFGAAKQLDGISDIVVTKDDNTAVENPDNTYFTIKNHDDTGTATISFTGAGLQKYHGATLTFSFNGKISSNTEIIKANGSIENKATLEYSPNSYGDVKNTIDDTASTVKVYGFKIKLTSSADGHAGVKNAQFKIYASEEESNRPGATPLGTITTDETGASDIAQPLGQHSYWLVESSVPAAYEPLANQNIVVLNKEDASKTGYKFDAETGVTTFSATVDPKPEGASDLPTTGGPGTIALTAIGVILMAGAIIWLIRSRKHEE